jgi:hypothetical protein
MKRIQAFSIDRGLAASVFTLTLIWCVFLSLPLMMTHGSQFPSRPNGLVLHDFGYFWGAARLFWLGKASLIFDPASFNAWLADQIAPGSMQQFATWSYPPTMLLPLLPFGLVSAPTALVLWTASTFMLLTLVLDRLFAESRATLAVLLSPAAFYSLWYGQNGALTAALIIAGLWLTDRWPVIAGACIGLLTIKPQLGILLPFALAAGGYWRAFASAALVASGVFVLTLLLFGVDAWAGFLDHTMPVMTAQLLHEYGIPPQYAMPTMLVTLQGWGASARLAGFGQGLSTLFAIAAVIWVWRQPRVDRQWRNALTCAALLLATPFGYLYDMIPAMLAVVLATRAGLRAGFAWPERPIFIAVWVWPAIGVPWTFYLGLRPIGGFALLSFVFCLLWRSSQDIRAWAEQR